MKRELRSFGHFDHETGNRKTQSHRKKWWKARKRPLKESISSKPIHRNWPIPQFCPRKKCVSQYNLPNAVSAMTQKTRRTYNSWMLLVKEIVKWKGCLLDSLIEIHVYFFPSHQRYLFLLVSIENSTFNNIFASRGSQLSDFSKKSFPATKNSQRIH